MSKELREQFEKETGMNFFQFPMLYAKWLEAKLKSVKDILISDEEIISKSTKYKNRGITALEKYIDYELLNAFEYQRERVLRALNKENEEKLK